HNFYREAIVAAQPRDEAQLRQIDDKTFSKRSFGVVITHTIKREAIVAAKPRDEAQLRQIDGKTFADSALRRSNFCH
ncbi:MAG: hypothetical protein RR058_07250, partial [Oscillospiraceae bacterium]